MNLKRILQPVYGHEAEKYLRIMKLTWFLILALTLQTSASLWSQTTKMDVDLKNSSLLELFNQIENNSEYRFFYSNDEVDVMQRVTVNAKQEVIGDILTEAFEDLPYSFKELRNNMILVEVKEESVKSIQQQKSVSGTVTDEAGDPLPGVTVLIKGTTNGTVTNTNGEYTISNVPEVATLQLSFVGMVTQEVAVDDQTTIDVTMIAGAIGIEEVVAVGYGVAKRSNLTGSISTVKADELSKVANVSVTHMLSGKASGVMVQQKSAQPGGGIDIIIRGAGSVNAGNQPLYVIDGFPVNNNAVEPGSGDRYSMGSRNPLNSLNPNDIESIEILKDASSTAIYGARAANGVILITTKRGAEGKTNVELSINHSIQNISKYFDMLNATEFMQQSNILGKEVYLIENNLAPYGPNDPEIADPFVPKFSEAQIAKAGIGTDWWDEVTKTGQIDEYNLSISGGNANTKYLISANYFDQTGVVYNSNFDRFSSRINLDQKIIDNLKIGVSLTGSYIDNGNIQLGDQQWEHSGVLVSALQMSPVVTVYNAYGEYSINPNDAVLPNPVSYREIGDQTISKRLMANTFAEWNIMEGLATRVSVGIDDKSGQRNNYMPNNFLYGSQNGGKGTKSLANSMDLLFNATVNYQKALNENHHISALLGYEYQIFKGDGFGTGNTKFFTDTFGSNNLGAGEGIPSTYSYRYKNQLASYFGRLQYNFKERYLMSFTLRRDGTSNFGENNKWGVFPSAALAWRVIEEDFIESFESLSNLKLRLAYGQTGNSGIGDKAFEYYAPRGNYLFGDAVQTAVGKSQLGNKDLKWETTTELNIGLDFGFFNNRISGSFEYFDKTVDDLLAYRSLPTYSDLGSIADNIGSTKLSGVELELSTVNIDRMFKWTTDFNFSSYKNRWKERNSDVILSAWQSEDDPIRAIFGYKTAGIVQIGEEIPHMPDALPGNIIYQDVNGFDENNQLTGEPDGKISQADNVLLGSSDPGFMFGFGNTFEFKGFDLNFFFYGMGDRILYNANRGKYMYDSRRLIRGENNQMDEVSEIFTAENPSTKYPSMAPNPYAASSDFLLEKADFIRLKNVTLGYSIPKKLFANKLDVRVYVDAQNLWTITSYSGVDPETDSLGAYPNQKSYSFGINVKF